MSDLFQTLHTQTTAPTAFFSRAEASICPRCNGEGGWRYVYCTTCRQYVNGRYGQISQQDEIRGLRPPIITECGHEAFSLPGHVACPECDGSGIARRQAA